MSGRLVISKHKSWHVWNQDNVEKVMRDERLHRERLEEEAQREKEKLQEKSIETLLGGTIPSTNDDNAGNKELFNLFGDVDEAAAEELRRKSKIKEQEMKNALLLRQNGAAPWAFGEGSSEKAREKMWYEALQTDGSASSATVMGRRVSGASAVSALSRDAGRKRRLDPMAGLLRASGTQEDWVVCVESKEDEGGLSYAEATLDKIRKINRNINSIDEERETSARNKHHSHKRGKDKKQRKEKRDKQKTDRDHWPGEQEDLSEADRLRLRLRRKRLEREAPERKKAAVLLATQDIYGSCSNSASSNR